jgi:chitinase
MKKFHVFLLVFVFLCSTAFAQRKYVGWSTGYRTTWGGPAFNSIQFRCYTHVCYFTGSINGPLAAEGKNFSTACHNNKSKAILCIGGWGTMRSFESSCANATSRAAFITRIVNSMTAGGFDGLDIDWEDEGGGIKATYTDLMKELRTALNAITPRPLLTVATAAYQSSSCPPIAAYVDQMNLMSYWALVGGMASQMNSFTSKGIPKTILGVGYGYDTDNEVDVDNPNDIGAKCLFAINNGYGGIMIWEIGRACAKCNDTTAYYVNKNATSTLPFSQMANNGKQETVFYVVNSARTGVREIRYSVPSSAGSQFIDLGLFDMRGSLVRSLVRGTRTPGMHNVPLAGGNAGFSISPGVYVVKMATPVGSQTGTLIMK